MKKKKIVVIGMILVLVLLLFPTRINLKDGITVYRKTNESETVTFQEQTFNQSTTGVGKTEQTIIYNGKEYKKSELSNATLNWLELPEKDRVLSSYLPPEFLNMEETWGITLTAEEITPTGAIIKCTQSGGDATGELHTGSWYILENWTQEYGWKEVPYVTKENIGWDDVAWVIPKEDCVEWEVNWEWLYGKLPAGKYRIGKSITDFRAAGDYDTVTYYAEFECSYQMGM